MEPAMPILPPAALGALRNVHPERDFLLLSASISRKLHRELGPLEMQPAKPTEEEAETCHILKRFMAGCAELAQYQKAIN
jgi:hypothetical protein